MSVSKDETVYRFVLEPRFAALKHFQTSRLFQHQTVPDIVAAVFKHHGFSGVDYRFQKSRSYTVREYVTQYLESDFDFINRLCEEEGIWYAFEQHEQHGDVVVFGDSPEHYLRSQGLPVSYRPHAGLGFVAYSEMLPQSPVVAFVLAKVAVNSAVMECDLVVFMQVGAYLFGAEFAADKGIDVLNQLRIELIGFSVLFGKPALPLCFFGAVLLPLGTVPFDFAADGVFVAVKLFGHFGDGAVAGQVLDVVSFVLGQLRVAHGNLSCRKGRMLRHTGLFLLWKVALQMRIRWPVLISDSL